MESGVGVGFGALGAIGVSRVWLLDLPPGVPWLGLEALGDVVGRPRDAEFGMSTASRSWLAVSRDVVETRVWISPQEFGRPTLDVVDGLETGVDRPTPAVGG